MHAVACSFRRSEGDDVEIGVAVALAGQQSPVGILSETGEHINPNTLNTCTLMWTQGSFKLPAIGFGVKSDEHLLREPEPEKSET